MSFTIDKYENIGRTFGYNSNAQKMQKTIDVYCKLVCGQIRYTAHDLTDNCFYLVSSNTYTDKNNNKYNSSYVDCNFQTIYLNI